MIRFGNVFHHFIGNFIGTGCPDINNLVVFLAFGNQTVLILFLKFFNLSLSFGNQGLFGFRNNQIVLTERNTGLAGIGKAECHNLIDKQAGFLLTAVTVNRVNNFTDFLFAQQSVNQ